MAVTADIIEFALLIILVFPTSARTADDDEPPARASQF